MYHMGHLRAMIFLMENKKAVEATHPFQADRLFNKLLAFFPVFLRKVAAQLPTVVAFL